MTDIFISLDVETTGPFPGIGELATIGAVAVHGDSLEILDRTFYVRLEPKSAYDRILIPRGYTEQQWLDAWEWDQNTRQWWLEQKPEVRAEALAPGLDRCTGRSAATQLAEWSRSFGGDPVFVAHPVGFDWAWINHLLLTHLLKPGMTVMDANPFGYRPACLRSMNWALGTGEGWKVDRSEFPGFHFEPETPHDALSDAHAQAKTLVAVLRAIRERAVDPGPAQANPQASDVTLAVTD